MNNNWKTLGIQTISKLLKVPLATVDATVLTEAGYVGEDVESILVRLFKLPIMMLTKPNTGLYSRRNR